MASVTPRRNRDGSVLNAATVPRVGNPKRVLRQADQYSITRAMDQERASREALQLAVRHALGNGASVRSLAEFTGMSTNTIMRWKKDAT